MSLLWQQCINDLSTQLDEPILVQWIRPLQLIEKKDSLKLLAPNRFIWQGVRENYLSFIQAALSRNSPTACPVELLVGHKTDGKTSAQRKEKTPVEQEVIQKKWLKSRPNATQTFSSFVTGPSNQLAQHAAQTVTMLRGEYNPLYLYGETSLGKTHLLNAINAEILQKMPQKKILLLHSEHFISRMVMAIQQHKIETFKDELRAVDVLLLDDIQMFAGKTRSQEELFHAFNALANSNCQIVLAGNRYPSQIEGLEKRLVSRFSGGLSCLIKAPSLETKIAILKKKSLSLGLALPISLATFIANHTANHIRALEGALLRVVAQKRQFSKLPLSLEMVQDAMEDLIPISQHRVTPEQILEHCAQFFQFSLIEIKSKSRRQPLVRARHLTMAILRDLTDLSLPEIGTLFGRNHTSILHATRRITEQRKNNKTLAHEYKKICASLTN